LDRTLNSFLVLNQLRDPIVYTLIAFY
jgi:hypothetical protein